MSAQQSENGDAQNTNTPEVFVTPISNTVGGKWYEITGPEDMKDAIEEQKEEHNTGEIMAADWQHMPHELGSQYDLMRFGERIRGYLDLLDEIGEDVAEAYVKHYSDRRPPEEWSTDIQDRLAGVYTSKEEYARTILDRHDTGDVPEHWLDVDAVIRDIEHGCMERIIKVSFDKVLVFRNEI